MTPLILRRGDIVLVPFPFTDLSGQKLRPAIIISPDPVGEDILLAFISSVVPASPEPNEYVLEATHPAFVDTGLKSASVFKMGKMVTLHRSLILRRLGRVTPELQNTLDAVLKRAIGLG